MSHNISNDLMVEIFERLPPKSVIRFRSLSKYWHSHLVSPEFLRGHRLRCSKNPQKVLIRRLTDCNYAYKDIYTLHSGDRLPLGTGPGYVGIPGVEFPFRQGTTEVVGSCNGVLCLHNKEISLWNFSIRRELIVPRHPCFKSYAKVVLGFGFDSITDDYKIVAISYYRSELHEQKTFIYSLKTDSWSAIPSPSTWFYDVKSKACFCNGTLHWVVDGFVTEEVFKVLSRFILTFDLSSHVFGHILLPRRWRIPRLTTINGCLAMVYSHCGVTWRICVMKEYNIVSSWSLLTRFKAVVHDEIRVIQLVTNGDLLAYYDGSYVCYPKTMLLTKLLAFGHNCFDLEMETYVESLELLDKERATTCGKTIFSWAKEDDH